MMLPLLRLTTDERAHSLHQSVATLADEFGRSDAERQELLPSGRQTTFSNRVGWAITYLKKAGLLEATRRAHFRITPLWTTGAGGKSCGDRCEFLDSLSGIHRIPPAQ